MLLESDEARRQIAIDPQANINFYTRLLRLRLVKETVNFDDPYAYHLYFGDESGTPGSIPTWFEYGSTPARRQRRRRRAGRLPSRTARQDRVGDRKRRRHRPCTRARGHQATYGVRIEVGQCGEIPT